MFKSFKRLAAALLVAVLIVGSLTVTSAEAAMKKPGNARFIQWNNTAFSSATIAWNKVSGAAVYQVRCVWTDGSNNVGGYVNGSYNAVKIDNLNYKHVYQAQVRGISVNSSGSITGYSPWSNIVFITPWPKNITGKLVNGTNVKLSWNIIYGSSGYNIFMTTSPSGTWYWNLSTSTYATSTSGTVKKYRGSKFKKYQNYYVRVITRRRRNGVFCTVPEPVTTPPYYQYRFYIYTSYS